MRILHLDAGREMRGGQWQALRLIEGLRASGVSCMLLARAGAPLYLEAQRRDIDVQALSLIRVFREARRHDLVHVHDAHSHTMAAITGGAPLVVARRVAFPTGARWKYRRASRYIAVSQFVKKVLCDGGIPEEKINVVPDGVPLLASSDRSGGVVAPANASDPGKGAAIAAQAADLSGIEIRFSTDLERDLAHAAIFVYLTHSEGLGSGVLLAMSAGVPCVASEVGGIPEIVQHRENGMLVDNSPQAVAGALRILDEQPDLAKQIAARARQTVEERFSIGRMVQGTMEVYRQVLHE